MSSIIVSKAAQGFVAANARPSCCNCYHGDQQFNDRMPPYDTAGWRCKKGGFYVTARAVCNQHQPVQPLGTRTFEGGRA